MLIGNIWSRQVIKDRFSISSSFPVLVTMIALSIGIALGTLTLSIEAAIVSAIAMAAIILLREDELAATIVIAVELCVDWYLSYRAVSVLLALALLFIFFLTRSTRRPWAEPRALWLWLLLLGSTILPAIRGALTIRDDFLYYPQIIFGAFIMFWLGTVLGRDIASIRRFLNALTVFSVLLALHTLIQFITGIFLFQSSKVEEYIISVGNYDLTTNSDISRLGSFFIQPNFSGTFFAMMFFVPLGLFVTSTSFWQRVFYFVAMLTILPALLFSYSTGAWLSAIVGIIAFVLLIGQIRYRLQLCFFIIASAIVLFFVFPAQVDLLLQHALLPSEFASRTAVWTTAIRVIQAFPLTGVGLGHQAYLLGAEPYRVPAQYIPLDHPHNSYLEWAAMAGLPVLFVFLVLLLFVLWQALRNWKRADTSASTVLGTGITVAIVLSFNSWFNQGWTLPPLAALGWMILGAISSPLLLKSATREVAQGKTDRRSE